MLDYEKKHSYSVRVVVTDTSGETARKGVTVTVLNIDEPPDLSGPVAVDYDENRRDMVASYTAVDPEGASVVWTLAGDDPDVFAISRGGVLTFGSPPDFEAPTGSGGDNTYSVTVQASDGTYTPTPSRTVTVSVTNQEEKGTVTLTPARPDVDVEISADLEDPDGGIHSRVWRWERSPNSRNWVPIPGAVEDSYTPTTADRDHYLRALVTYDDGEGPTKDATAATAGRVPNPTRPPPPPPPSPPPSPPPGPSSGPGPGPSGGGGPEPLPPGANHPPEFGEGSRTVRTVAENSPAGTDIGAPVTATDPEGDALAYKLAGTAADTFDLDTATGQLKTRAALDYETRNSYTITVEVRDGKNPEGEADRRRDDSIRVTIMVGNRNDPGWVTLSAPTPRVDQPLQAVLSDPDGDIAGVVWKWESSTDQNSWTPIPDAATNTYTPTPSDADHHLRVTATYSDPFGPANTATAAPPNPVTVGHTTTFTDVDPQGVHAPAIEALAADGLFVDTECGEGLFCPDQPIQRSTMAIWLIRILGGDPPNCGGIPLRRHTPTASGGSATPRRSPTATSPSAVPPTHPDTAPTAPSPAPRWPASWSQEPSNYPQPKHPPGSQTPKATPTKPTSTPSPPPESPSDATPTPSNTAPTNPSPERRWPPSCIEPSTTKASGHRHPATGARGFRCQVPGARCQVQKHREPLSPATHHKHLTGAETGATGARTGKRRHNSKTPRTPQSRQSPLTPDT